MTGGPCRGGHPRGVAALVADIAAGVLPVDGAAVLLMADPTHWSAVSATDPMICTCENLQVTVGEGPSIEARSAGGPVLLPDLAHAARRWPVFASQLPRPVRAWFSFPLQVGAARFGVLDLYRCAAGRLDARALADALKLADRTATALVHRPAVDLLAESDLGPGIDHGFPQIDQATGMVSVHLGVDLAAAYARLRAAAFAADRELVEVAGAVVDGRLRLDDRDAGGGSER